MADAIKKAGKQGLIGATGFVDPNLTFKKTLRQKSSQLVEPRKGTTGRQRQAQQLNLLQLQREKARVEEAESEIASRRGLAGSRVGRSSLIKSNPTGLSQNLGGT